MNQKAKTFKDMLMGVPALPKICSSVLNSGHLAQACCALDQSRIGCKYTFVYTKAFSRGDEVGVIVATHRGWIAMSTEGQVLGISPNWSGTNLYLTEGFSDQFKDIILLGLPAVTLAKLLDVAQDDEEKAIRHWKTLSPAIQSGIEALTALD